MKKEEEDVPGTDTSIKHLLRRIANPVFSGTLVLFQYTQLLQYPTLAAVRSYHYGAIVLPNRIVVWKSE
jgi:hypothetical protein